MATRPRWQHLAVMALAAVIAAGTLLSAQRIWVGRGRYGRTPPKWATAADLS